MQGHEPDLRRPTRPPRGRGTPLNPTSRFDRLSIEPDLDDPVSPDADDASPRIATEFYRDASRTIITRNESPDVPYDFSINPYRGCEHGCIYCYARPYHEYLGMSAGLDFETKIFVKEDAPALFRSELARPSWRGDVLGMSGVTDCYQPIERRLRLTRQCVEIMADCRQPVGVVTKNALVARDADLYGELARHGAAHVCLTITTLDETLRRSLEPRTSTADARFDAVARLTEAGVPTGIMVAPVIPGLTDHEIPTILGRAREAGASFADYTLVRLPHGVAALFEAWLSEHRPGERDKILGRVKQVRHGCMTDSKYGRRMRGEGAIAELTAQLFDRARSRVGLTDCPESLSSASFRRPARACPLFEL
jgi:DNA repair photolyase